jgi:hypothetical protein
MTGICMFTYEQYADFAKRHGCSDEIDLKLGYDCYIAMFNDDPKALARADTNLFWNNLYRAEGKFN